VAITYEQNIKYQIYSLRGRPIIENSGHVMNQSDFHNYSRGIIKQLFGLRKTDIVNILHSGFDLVQ